MVGQRALVIGIDDYPGTGSDLEGCVNDARDWAAALEQRGRYEVAMLTDSDATKANMIAAIREILAATAAGQVTVITYSGHGTWLPSSASDEPDGRTEALCPHDVKLGELFTDDELHDLFGERPAGSHVVLISDSCHSGTVARHSGFGGDGIGRSRFLPPAMVLSERAAARAEQVAPDRFGWSWPVRRRQHEALLLSGCQDHEYSYDARFNGRPNGAFTYAALRALSDLPDGATYKEWHHRIRRLLPSRFYPQTPGIQGTAEQQAMTALNPFPWSVPL